MRARLDDPGFTPSVRDIDALVELLADDDTAKPAERALARVGSPALAGVRAQLESAGTPVRARLVRVVGRIAQEERDEARAGEAVSVLLAAIEDADPKARRNAAIALGHVPAGEKARASAALHGAWHADPRPEMRRSIAASLGKVGTAESLDLLRGQAASDDTEMARIAHRAAIMVARTASRAGRGGIEGSRAPSAPVRVAFLARWGLEELVAGELSRIAAVSDVREVGPGRVEARLTGRLDALFAARTALAFAFPLAPEPIGSGETPAAAVARAAAGPEARAILDAFTVGAVRYRIAWAEGGHQRAATWDTASAIAASAPDFVNDPTASLWEFAASIREGATHVALVPRALPDPRFAWRRRDVPAASHPTLAAALARVASTRSDDVVWDPFVGSGAELVERALLGPYRALLGSDIDARAIAAAEENLRAAGLEARLDVADAWSYAPRDVTLVITNPPMGRRAARAPGLTDRLDRFVAHAARVLRPGGRLVWIAPWPASARESAVAAGLSLDWAKAIDMGGFDAELQRWVKPR